MKKALFGLVLGLALLSVPARAELGMGVGFEGGVAFANLNLTPASSLDSKTGLAFGAFVEWELGSFFYLQPELLYVMKGASQTTLGIETKTHLNDLEIPLLLKLKIDAGPAAIYALAGPALGFSLSRQSEINGVKTDITSIKSSDVTFHLGGGMMLSLLPTVNFILEGRYIMGLMNRSETPTTTTSLKTQTLVLMGGLAFIL